MPDYTPAMRTAPLVLTLLLVVAPGCAGPLYGGPPLAGAWRATDDELGSMTLEVQEGVAGGVDCVLTGVDGARFEFDATLEEDGPAGGFEVELEVGTPGLKVLFGPAGTNEVEGTINFAMGVAHASFRRPTKEAPYMDAKFWRASRPQDTLKTIRLSEVPGGAGAR